MRSYNRFTDYMSLINASLECREYKLAKKLERKRNRKIDKERLPYEKTHFARELFLYNAFR